MRGLLQSAAGRRRKSGSAGLTLPAPPERSLQLPAPVCGAERAEGGDFPEWDCREDTKIPIPGGVSQPGEEGNAGRLLRTRGVDGREEAGERAGRSAPEHEGKKAAGRARR